MSEKEIWKNILIFVIWCSFSAVAIGITIAMMIKGWGLEAKSYGWIWFGGMSTYIMAFVTGWFGKYFIKGE